MKFKTFKELIKLCKEIYNTTVQEDLKLQEALGGDTVVVTDTSDVYITKIIESIESEFGDETGLVDWFFWECVMSLEMENTKCFYEDDVPYEGNYVNVYLGLLGRLNKNFEYKE